MVVGAVAGRRDRLALREGVKGRTTEEGESRAFLAVCIVGAVGREDGELERAHHEIHRKGRCGHPSGWKSHERGIGAG